MILAALPLELPYPDINPEIDLGPVSLKWYGLMYVVGFAAAWFLGRWRARRPGWAWEPDEIDDLIFYAGLGVILGGRLGWVLFYGLEQAVEDPLSIVRIDQGGMSFHGGLLGVLLALWLYGRKTGRTFFQVADFIAPLVPLGLFAGRIGNFINGELWGKPTDLPWGMVFPTADDQPRHPSMLYEALLEGLVLFAILWVYSSRRPPTRAVSGAFLIGYGVFRSLVELVRIPDDHLGYLGWGWLTMGQILSLPMVLAGIALLVSAYRRREPQPVPDRAPAPGPAAGQGGTAGPRPPRSTAAPQ